MNETTRGEAYHTGYEARVQGEARGANPYPAGTWDADEWIAGYSDGMDLEIAARAEAD